MRNASEQVFENRADSRIIKGKVGVAWYSHIFKLRSEEFFALLFLVPMIFYSIKGYLYYKSLSHIPITFIESFQRFGTILGVIAAIVIIARLWPKLGWLRNLLPIGFCLGIYINLHETIRFINPHDIQDHLMAIDQYLFGVQPSIWFQQFIHPYLTEYFSFCYMNFFLLAPIVAIALYLSRKPNESRETIVSAVLCLYIGYILYAIFPAVSPSIAIRNMYTIPFNGALIADLGLKMESTFSSASRDAFPSLHTAVTLLVLLLAFKHIRWLFWALLPFGLGLFISTVYLRHHYVIDLIAGIPLGILAFIYIPKFNSWWLSKKPQEI